MTKRRQKRSNEPGRGWFRGWRQRWGEKRATAVTLRWPSLGVWVEISLITLWALWVGRSLLDFNPYTWLQGREFGSQIQAFHFWTQLKACGQCALWNGNINGGSPALGDVFSSTFHPFVAIPTLIWGVIIGTKVAVVLALWLAGIAQWRLAFVMGLGRIARVWVGCLAIVGGHLAGRLEGSVVGIVISTSACSLVLTTAVELGITGKRRATIRLAIALALAIVAGQGYMQLGLIGWAPAFLFFLFDKNLKLRPVWREYFWAVALALLLSAFFIVPLMHFLPNFTKSTNPSFPSAQPLEYMPLNLLIRDRDFMLLATLGKLPYPYLYNIFVGWVPVLLAILAIRYARRQDYPLLLCLGSGMVLSFAVASAIPLQWLSQWFSGLTGFRFTALIAGLAVPAVLGLAAYGLDRLLGLAWPQLMLHLQREGNGLGGIQISLRWLLVLPLFWALQTAYELSQNYLFTEDHRKLYGAVGALNTSDLQWVAVPLGEHFWVEPALAQGIKLAPVDWAWAWKYRLNPQPKLIVNRDGPPPDTVEIGVLDDIPLYEHDYHTYAYVSTPTQITPCQASGRAGELRVLCNTDTQGLVVVQENNWDGWHAWRDGEPVALTPQFWLSTPALAGEHEYVFRYQPLDVIFGLLFTLVGVVLTIAMWLKSGSGETADEGVLAEATQP